MLPPPNLNSSPNGGPLRPRFGDPHGFSYSFPPHKLRLHAPQDSSLGARSLQTIRHTLRRSKPLEQAAPIYHSCEVQFTANGLNASTRAAPCALLLSHRLPGQSSAALC